jgi:hypothetical protein
VLDSSHVYTDHQVSQCGSFPTTYSRVRHLVVAKNRPCMETRSVAGREMPAPIAPTRIGGWLTAMSATGGGKQRHLNSAAVAASGRQLGYAEVSKPSGTIKPTAKGTGTAAVPAASSEAAPRRTSAGASGSVSGPLRGMHKGTTLTTAQVENRATQRAT